MTSWILEEPFWFLLLIPMISWIFILSRRPSSEVHMPWGFLCPPVQADHQPARRGKMNWMVFLLASLGALCLTLLLAKPRSSKGKVFLFQPQWVQSLNTDLKKSWLDELTKKWPEGVLPAFYTFSGGPYELDEINNINLPVDSKNPPANFPTNFSCRVYPTHKNRITYSGDFNYPLLSEVTLHDMVRNNSGEALITVASPQGVLPQCSINGLAIKPTHQEAQISTFSIPLSNDASSLLKITTHSSMDLPPIFLPQVLNPKDFTQFPKELIQHEPFTKALALVPWSSKPHLPGQSWKHLGSMLKTPKKPSSLVRTTPSGLPLQGSSSSRLQDQGEHLGFNWPLTQTPKQILTQSKDLTLFSIGRHPMISRGKERSLPWTFSFNPIELPLLSPQLEIRLWELLLKDGFSKHWSPSPLFPQQSPANTSDGKPQEVQPFPRFLFWLLTLTMISSAIFLHRKSIRRITMTPLTNKSPNLP